MWSLGAHNLNRDSQASRVLLDNNGESKQIDVIARFGKTIFVIECKHAEERSRRTVAQDIREINDYSRKLTPVFQKLFGESTSVKYILALNNIDPSESDLVLASEKRVSIWNSFYISYFEDLFGRLGKDAFYQVCAETFFDEEVPDYPPHVPAIRVTDPNGLTGYSFVCYPKDLIKISYVHHRKLNQGNLLNGSENPYQRMVNKGRVADIREYIQNHRGSFANNVIVNFSKPPRFKVISTLEGIEYGDLTFPRSYKAAWIIDGQHRLLSYAGIPEGTTALIPVFAYEGLPADRQGKLFIDINEHQKKVDANLLWDLYSDIYYGSKEDKNRLLCLISRVGKGLNAKRNGALENHIYVPSVNEKDTQSNISLYTLCNRLKKGNFLKAGRRPGELFHETEEDTVDFAVERLDIFFQAIKDECLKDWNNGEKGFVRSNFGIAVLLLVFKHILLDFRRSDRNIVQDLKIYRLKLTEYTKPLTAHLTSLDDEQLKEMKSASSEAGYVKVAAMLCLEINKVKPDFNPEILSNDETGEEDSNEVEEIGIQSIEEIESALRDLIHTELLTKYGANYWNRDGVIPQYIKEQVAGMVDSELERYPFKTQEEFQQGEALVRFLSLNHYKDIILKAQNWDAFKPKFRHKPRLEKSFVELIEYRNNRVHNRVADSTTLEIINHHGIGAIRWFRAVLGLD